MKTPRAILILALCMVLAFGLVACGGGGGGSDSGGSDTPTSLSAPANLKAASTGADGILLTWSAPDGNINVSGYKVYRDGTLAASALSSAKSEGTIIVEETRNEGVGLYAMSGEPSAQASSIVPNSITTTSYSDDGLTANTSHCYTVTAYDDAGNESDHSNEACATTEAASCEEGGLPLQISDLDFPDSVTAGQSTQGTVSYTGSFNDIANPVMALRLSTSSSTTTSYVTSPGATASNCVITFKVSYSSNISGTGTSYFELVDFDSTSRDNWEDNGVSNMLSQTVTVK